MGALDLPLILSLVESRDYLAAIALLRDGLSGIDWDEDSSPCEALTNDLDLYHAINACHMGRLYSKDATFHRQAEANIRALISQDRSDLEAMEERDATIACIELGI